MNEPYNIAPNSVRAEPVEAPFFSASDQSGPSTSSGRAVGGIAAALTLSACATQVPSAVDHAATTPGFLLGVWHGFIFPVAWVLSLFMPEVAVYAVPNNGGWYDFGFFVGVMFLGVGARKGRTVYVTRRVR